jgi:hypothetical protein
MTSAAVAYKDTRRSSWGDSVADEAWSRRSSAWQPNRPPVHRRRSECNREGWPIADPLVAGSRDEATTLRVTVLPTQSRSTSPALCPSMAARAGDPDRGKARVRSGVGKQANAIARAGRVQGPVVAVTRATMTRPSFVLVRRRASRQRRDRRGPLPTQHYEALWAWVDVSYEGVDPGAGDQYPSWRGSRPSRRRRTLMPEADHPT